MNPTTRQGLFVTGQFLLGEEKQLSLPTACIIRKDGYSYVFKVDSDNYVSRVKVEVGQITGNTATILSGVSPSDNIVNFGVGFLNHGDLVNVVNTVSQQDNQWGNMNISAFFTRHPIPGILLFILLSLAGFWGFSKMTVKLFPDIDVPIIVVTVLVPGGSPQQLEYDVASKIEDKLASLAGLNHVYSTLVDNAAIITVEFRIEKSVQSALDDVRSAVNEVRGDLPSTAENPIITKLALNEQPLFIFSIDSSSLDATDLSWYVENDLTKALLGIRGVGGVTRIGGVEREVQVLVDPTTLFSYQTMVSDISQQISLMQQNFSGSEADLGGLKQPIRTIAVVNDSHDLNHLSISVPGGRIIKLNEIATIKDTFKEQTSKALLNGKEGIAFIVQRSKGYGDLDVGRAVKAELAKISENNPHLTITEVFETMSAVEEDFNGAMKMLAEGAVLAVFVVLLFWMGQN